jgi:RNA polymerase sigma-70 factor (ECF subfamily)
MEELQAVASTLEQLPPLERVVLVMRQLEGMSQQEIAATLNLSKGYVSKLVHRAIARIRAAGWEFHDA